jgi:hypothetical protein
MSMNNMNFEFDKLVKLLRRSENDPEIRGFFGRQILNVERDEFYGSLEFKSDGVEVVFQEASWVVSPKGITDPKELYLVAFHLHREGHDSYAGYSGHLPNGVVLGDSEAEVLQKMGLPSIRGGGNMFPVLNRPVPYWFRYTLGDATLRFQLDPTGQIELATLSAFSITNVT